MNFNALLCSELFADELDNRIEQLRDLWSEVVNRRPGRCNDQSFAHSHLGFFPRLPMSEPPVGKIYGQLFTVAGGLRRKNVPE